MTSFTDPAIAVVTGSSAPTGKPPTFEPIAPASAPRTAPEQPSDRMGYGIVRRPRMRSASERLGELVGEYDRAIDFWNAACGAEDDGQLSADERERGKFALDHANRILAGLERMIQALPASNIHDLGLKARVISWSDRMSWDEGIEPSLRNLVDDVLLLAGMDRIRAPTSRSPSCCPATMGRADTTEPVTRPSRGERR